jgi:hypothetical protein
MSMPLPHLEMSEASRLGIAAIFAAPTVPAGYEEHGPCWRRKKPNPGVRIVEKDDADERG